MAYTVFSKLEHRFAVVQLEQSFSYTVSLETVFLPHFLNLQVQLSENELFCHQMTVLFLKIIYTVFLDKCHIFYLVFLLTIIKL